MQRQLRRVSSARFLFFSEENLFPEFGCSGKISDDMREKILDYHNQAKIRLAKGQEQNKTGKLPSAKNMYEVVSGNSVRLRQADIYPSIIVVMGLRTREKSRSGNCELPRKFVRLTRLWH